MKKCFHRLTAASLFLAAMAAPAMAQPGTDITYQGRLKLAGALVNTPADFQFRLYGQGSGGNQIGPTQQFNNVSVVDGLFTAKPDFGPGAFNGNGRFLEIAVRSPAGSGNFVILTPRQILTAAPFALKVPGVNGYSLNSVDGSILDAVYVSNGGAVGIGTTNPQAKLDVRAGGGGYLRVDSANTDLHTNGGSDGVFGIYNDTQGAAARTEIVMSNSPKLVVNGDGQVGIPGIKSLRKFSVQTPEIFTGHFEGSNLIGSVIELGNTSAGVTWEMGIPGTTPPAGLPTGALYFSNHNGFDIPFVIAPNSWIGMGVTNPGFRLDLPNIANNDGRGRANQWVTYSSGRWKTNVQTIDHALDKVMHMRGVSFDWNADHGGAHDVGFIAEEVGAIVPELVTWEADGKSAQGLAYDRVTALTVEAIKEQQAQLDEVRQSNAELREQVAALLQAVAALEKTAASK